MPKILASEEAEAGEMQVQGQPQPLSKNLLQIKK